MTEAAERLKTELANLPDSDRAELAYFLIHSLDQTEDADTEAAWDAELARRENEIANGKATGIPAENVWSALRKKYS